MTTFSVRVDKLHDDEVSESLSDSDALASGEVVMNKYISIEFQQSDANASVEVLGSLVRIYYTASDLDVNGDGDGDDLEDLNESSLCLFLMSADGEWIRLSDTVDTTGVNTTDVEIFGISYEGYVWANVTGLSLFGIAGQPDKVLPGPGIPWLLIGLAALAAVVLIAAAIMIRRRRRPGEGDQSKAGNEQ